MDVDDHNATVLNTLNDGDLVEFPRPGMYSHWGVSIENQQIVHLTGVDGVGTMDACCPGSSSSICGVNTPKACVKTEDFFKVANGCKARRNNAMDSVFSPLHPDEIVRRAKGMVGEIGYNVLWNNCEHFATFLRYGKKWSGQAGTALALTVVVGAGGMLAGGILALLLGLLIVVINSVKWINMICKNKIAYFSSILETETIFDNHVDTQINIME